MPVHVNQNCCVLTSLVQTSLLVFVQNMSTTCDEATLYKGEKKEKLYYVAKKCEAIE